jgi:hypothetical protein
VINKYVLRVSGVLQPEATRREVFKELAAKKLITDQLIIIGSPATRGTHVFPRGGDTVKQPYANGYVQPHANGYVQPYAHRYDSSRYYHNQDVERRKAAEKVAQQAIIADMLKDGLITQTRQLSFVLSGTSFTINGKKQPQDVFEKYKQKYVPANGGPGWTWSHSHNDDGSHNDIDSNH